MSSDIITAGARPAAQSRPGLVSSHVPPPVTSARSTPDTADGGRRVVGVGGGRGGHEQELPGRGGGDWWLESCDYTSSAAQPAPTTATVPLYRTVHCTIATVQSTTSEDTLYSILKLNLSIYLKESCKDKQLRRLFLILSFDLHPHHILLSISYRFLKKVTHIYAFHHIFVNILLVLYAGTSAITFTDTRYQ